NYRIRPQPPMHNSTQDKTLKCIRCGFCLDACPTFRLTGNEADSPRGRIYLMRSVGENVIPLDASVLEHIDSCLGCRACETACPSGVEYGDILEHFRAEIESQGLRSGGQKLARRQLLATLTSPVRLAASLKVAGMLNTLTGKGGKLPSFAAAMITGDPNAEVTLPALPSRVQVGK